MEADDLSINDLSIASGLTRRALRFYVQQKLIDPPAGLGRGRQYGKRHLSQIRKIGELQSAGHSLEEIRRILNGAEEVPHQPTRTRARPLVTSQLMTRLHVADGIELNFDARHFSPDGRTLARL